MLSAMRMSGDMRGGGRLGVLARVLVLGAMQVGVVIALVWAVLAVGEGRNDLWPSVVVIAFAVVCLAGAIALWLSAEDGHSWSFGAATVVVVSAGVLLFSEIDMVQQQALHDRGVQATGVVVRQWDSYGFSEAAERYTEIRLADGTKLTAVDDLHSRRAGGTPVLVTYDPRMRVPAQVGPRPGAPASGWRTAGFLLLCAGALALAAANADSLSYPRSWSAAGRRG
ncbi:hypothetical protein AB0B01_11615 [Streptomyces sp. NPDC044571]|uniref:hypothetical protein n=1 Tax=Streptomyces sp. NPDC044571 TaxID=3155371 RepID=UPI0033C8BAD9